MSGTAVRIGIRWVWVELQCSKCDATFPGNRLTPTCPKCGVTFVSDVTEGKPSKASPTEEGTPSNASPTESRPAKRSAPEAESLQVDVPEEQKRQVKRRAVNEMMDRERSHSFKTARSKVVRDFDEYALSCDFTWKSATDDDVAAFLLEIAAKGRSSMHHASCTNWGVARICDSCHEDCCLGAAPGSLETKAKTLAAAFAARGRVGRYSASAVKNNPAQSNKVALLVNKYKQQATKKGFSEGHRVPLLSKDLASVLIRCQRLMYQARRGSQRVDASAATRASSLLQWVKLAQLGTVIAVAHARSQRGASMAEIRSRSVALFGSRLSRDADGDVTIPDQGDTCVLFNALLTKTRRQGAASTLVIHQRRVVHTHVCSVRWYLDLVAAYRAYGVYDEFVKHPGSYFFCKIDAKGVHPTVQSNPADWSKDLVALMKECDVYQKGMGISSLRGGGAIVQMLQGKSLKEVMEQAEWKRVLTFERYSSLQLLFNNGSGSSTLRALVASESEQSWLVANEMTTEAIPLSGQHGGSELPSDAGQLVTSSVS